MTSQDSSSEYILEFDQEYPDILHVLHNDYPLALEKLPTSYDILPDYCNKIADKYHIKVRGVKKLLSNFGNKNKYVVHYRNLQLSLSLFFLIGIHSMKG